MGAERVAAIGKCGAEIVAVADVDPLRSSTLASAHGAAAYSSVQSLPWLSLDAVFLCTPPAFRLDTVRCAVRHGVPILVEKPLAVDAPSARELVDLADGLPVKAVGYMNRYRPGVQMARHLARSHDVVGIVCNWSGKRYGVPWWNDRAQSGGPINEQATHIVDLCRFLGGDITEILAIGNDGETRLGAVLRLESGAIATLFYTCEASEKCISLELVTAGGHLRLSGWDFRLESVDRQHIGDEISPFVAETKAFLAAAAAGHSAGILCDFQEAYRTQLAVDRIREESTSVERRGALAT